MHLTDLIAYIGHDSRSIIHGDIHGTATENLFNLIRGNGVYGILSSSWDYCSFSSDMNLNGNVFGGSFIRENRRTSLINTSTLSSWRRTWKKNAIESGWRFLRYKNLFGFLFLNFTLNQHENYASTHLLYFLQVRPVRQLNAVVPHVQWMSFCYSLCRF